MAIEKHSAVERMLFMQALQLSSYNVIAHIKLDGKYSYTLLGKDWGSCHHSVVMLSHYCTVVRSLEPRLRF